MSIEISQEAIEKILQGISVPPQPQVLVDLQMEQYSPGCSEKQLSQLISQDAGLSGTILKTVNSQNIKAEGPVCSIEEAVCLLGKDNLINIINGLTIKGELSDEHIVALGHFWDSSYEIAKVCAAIAKQLELADPDDAYTLGLCHNAGIPLLMFKFPNYLEVVEESYRATEESIATVEDRLISTNHAVVGYYTAKSWKLPSYICEAIRDHHAIEKVFSEDESDSRTKNLLAILKITEFICESHSLLGQQKENYEWQRIRETVLMYAGISEYDLAALVETLAEQGFEVSNHSIA